MSGAPSQDANPKARLAQYGLAIGLVAAATLLRGSLNPWMGDRAPFGLFTMAILVAAFFGGLGPGLFATVLAAGVGVWLFMPSGWGSANIGILVIFVANALLISALCGALRRTRLKMEIASEGNERSESQRQESEKRFRLLADSAPILIWIAEESGHCTWFNRQRLAFTGRQLEEEVGMGWTQCIHPADRNRCVAAYAEAFAKRTAFDLDYRLRRHDDVYRWVMDRGIPLVNNEGEFVGFVGSCLDIQLRKEASDQIESALNNEHTARVEAERMVQLKDEFLATVSHEMRTPLTAILGWVQLLRRGSLSGDAIPQAFETIERNARNQAALIDELLDMSKLISGRLQLDVMRINPSEVVAAAILTSEPSAAAKGVHLIPPTESFNGGIVCDSARLEQIVSGLIQNAIKFTPSGGEVSVSMQKKAGFVEIAVRDTGEGIAPDFLPHVFDPFRQQDSSSRRRHPGLGIGLALVKQLVELHGGTVGVVSAGIGRGSTFVVALPCDENLGEQTVQKLAVQPGRAEEYTAIPTLLGRKILVVDDDPDAREVIRSVLAHNGASVRTAGSAREGLQQFEALKPDVVLSDIGMPDEDGFEFVRQLRERQRPEGGLTPAIALTAFVRSDDRQRALRAGFQMHLSKPIEAFDLVTAVASLLSPPKN